MPGGSSAPTVEDLIGQHHALLYRYAYRLSGSAADAEDLTQQTYLIACQNLDQLREPSAAKSWLCSILRRAFLRGCQVRSMTIPLESVVEPSVDAAPTDIDEEALRQALEELPEEYRSAVILYYFQELSYKEIAEVLEIPLGTVMSRLARGKTMLKNSVTRWAPARPEPRRPGSKSPTSFAVPKMVPCISD